MKYIDLFAGIGGFRLALDNLGQQCVFSSEINGKCQLVYKNNFGDQPHGDITQISPADIPDFDILVGGFPCQPFSLCGLKQGFKDQTRGTLFFNIAEIISVKRPKMLLLENVKGLVTHDKGKTQRIILDTLNDLGYTTHTKVLDTYDFGIPQYRERWYCVAFDKNISYTFPQGGRAGTTLRDVIDPTLVDPNLVLPCDELAQIDYHFAHYHKTPRVQHSTAHCNPDSKKGRYGIYSYLKPDNALRFHMGDPAKSQIQDDYYVSLDSVAPTLIATRAPKMWDLRRHMSVDECKKLQGFPDDFDMSSVSIKVAKKQLGNAVTIRVVQEIAEQMLKAYLEERPLPPLQPTQLDLTMTAV